MTYADIQEAYRDALEMERYSILADETKEEAYEEVERTSYLVEMEPEEQCK